MIRSDESKTCQFYPPLAKMQAHPIQPVVSRSSRAPWILDQIRTGLLVSFEVDANAFETGLRGLIPSAVFLEYGALGAITTLN
jgi:hypothetical protein